MRSVYGGLSNNGTVNLNATTHFSIGAINSANFSGGAFNVLAGETMLAADGSATEQRAARNRTVLVDVHGGYLVRKGSEETTA